MSNFKQDEAYAFLKNQIVTCNLSPGEIVSEPKLRERFSLNPAATRSALLRLSQYGLMRPVPRQGYIVSPITIQTIKETLHLRKILEREATVMATGNVDIGLLREYDNTWSKNIDEDIIAGKGSKLKLERALLGNFQFHMHIAEASGSKKLAEYIEPLLYEGERLTYMGLPIAYERAEVQSGHSLLIDALEKKDSALAATYALQHVQSAEDIVLKAIVEQREFRNLTPF